MHRGGIRRQGYRSTEGRQPPHWPTWHTAASATMHCAMHTAPVHQTQHMYQTHISAYRSTQFVAKLKWATGADGTLNPAHLSMSFAYRLVAFGHPSTTSRPKEGATSATPVMWFSLALTSILKRLEGLSRRDRRYTVVVMSTPVTRQMVTQFLTYDLTLLSHCHTRSWVTLESHITRPRMWSHMACTAVHSLHQDVTYYIVNACV